MIEILCLGVNQKLLKEFTLDQNMQRSLRACYHADGVTRLDGVTTRSYDLLFYLEHVYMIGEVTPLGGLSGLSGRVTLSAGVAICQVNVSRLGNPPSRGCVHVTLARTPPGVVRCMLMRAT